MTEDEPMPVAAVPPEPGADPTALRLGLAILPDARGNFGELVLFDRATGRAVAAEKLTIEQEADKNLPGEALVTVRVRVDVLTAAPG